MINLDSEALLSKLPYSNPFLFVEEILETNENQITGKYTFQEDSWFYKGHFKDYPVTPGVILTECMAQIGVVCLGIYLLFKENHSLDFQDLKIGMSSTEMGFYKPVFPGETVKVISKKEYFRFNKLKCSVEMFDAGENLVCRGKIAGMISSEKEKK